MIDFVTRKTVYSVRDFLSWNKAGTLTLNPDFQRRPHWKPAAKAFLIDTVLRGYPIPIVFIRERPADLDLEPSREVVDGQQRLRTLIAFADPKHLREPDPKLDKFEIDEDEFGATTFAKLSVEMRNRLLDYQVSTHVLPSDTDDRLVLEIFARMNATGTRLTEQELRNARYFGAFKKASYRLALEQLYRWRDWGIFKPMSIARMQEVETTSDLLITMINGISGKSKASINRAYRTWDKKFPSNREASRRFRLVMDAIESSLSEDLKGSAWRRVALFYTLFCVYYDRMFEFGTGMAESPKPKSIPSGWRKRLLDISSKVSQERVPKAYADAFEKATADPGRRQRRFEYVKSELARA